MCVQVCASRSSQVERVGSTVQGRFGHEKRARTDHAGRGGRQRKSTNTGWDAAVTLTEEPRLLWVPSHSLVVRVHAAFVCLLSFVITSVLHASWLLPIDIHTYKLVCAALSGLRACASLHHASLSHHPFSQYIQVGSSFCLLVLFSLCSSHISHLISSTVLVLVLVLLARRRLPPEGGRHLELSSWWFGLSRVCVRAFE